VNFFERQQAAKSMTLRLVVLFTIAVVALVGVIDAVTALVMHSRGANASSVVGVVVGVSAITLLIIAGGMISKTVALRQGGAAVAASVGAVPVDPTTSDPQLRRFVNIVEEMSLASGVPTPRLFVMEREQGINAFAAGFTPADAAITVTGGALAQLNRDELQGVIGHEFSHILNGDMRINIRLIGLLSGILLIGLIGLRVLSFGGGGRDRDRNGAPILVIAIAMMVLGFVGVFFANLIQAAVSRQREWLADASAVQFTRQTTGLEGALKKIAGVPTGSALRDQRSAQEVSHMLFGEGRRSFSALYASHPPLVKRIQALDPSFDPREIEQLEEKYSAQPPNGMAEDASRGLVSGGPAAPAAAATPAAAVPPPARRTIAATPAQVSARAGTLTPQDLEHGASLSAQVPAQLRQLATQATTAPTIVLAMLMSDDPAIHARQVQAVSGRLGSAIATDVASVANQVGGVPQQLRLPLISIALPQLAARPRPVQDALLGALNDLALADGSVSLFEYCATRLVWSYLHDAADPSARSRGGTANARQAQAAIVTLLGALAVAGTDDAAQARHAFDTAIAHVLPGVTPPAQAPSNTWQALDASWAALDALSPSDKQRVVEAMVAAVLDDGTLTEAEGELLRAACALMHVPIPALIT
jgi:Zn-dependent protease with chaperone function